MMNEVLKAIRERRSIRSFSDEMPDRETIEKIIEAGLWAPSAQNRQKAIILAVTNKELRDRLAADNARIAGATAFCSCFSSSERLEN